MMAVLPIMIGVAAAAAIGRRWAAPPVPALPPAPGAEAGPIEEGLTPAEIAWEAELRDLAARQARQGRAAQEEEQRPSTTPAPPRSRGKGAGTAQARCGQGQIASPGGTAGEATSGDWRARGAAAAAVELGMVGWTPTSTARP